MSKRITLAVDDIEVLEEYAGKEGRRDWGRMGWLYPGDIVVQISGESAKRLQLAIANPSGGDDL